MTTTLEPVQAAPPPSAPARRPLPSSTALVVWVVGALSALALWGLVYPVLIGALQEQDSQQQLFATLRKQLAHATAPLGPTGYGKPVALLDVPDADIHGQVVVEGTGGQDLEKGPGHLRSTVLPGQAGTSVLLGRGLAFGGPFRHLPDLRPGDRVTVTTGQGAFTYVVERLRHPGDPLPGALAAGQSRLVLATSAGAGWRAGVAPTSVLYVDALLRKGAAPSSGDASRLAVPASERPMGVSTDALLGLVLWLQGLLLAVVGVCWLAARWGRLRSWAVGFPVLAAVAIAASGQAAQLLPNLL